MDGTKPSQRSFKNPFVGPRPLEIGERIYGRDREINELVWMLDAERIVLLYSPSGAGKSSLAQAGLIPRLRHHYDVWRPTRLNLELPRTPEAIRAINRYVYSAIQGWEEGIPKELRRPPDELSRLTLPEYLASRPRRPDAPRSILLIVDQFEEILTVDALALEAKNEFFDQLGTMLHDPTVWALFLLREDYLAPLDPYVSRVPTQLQNRYRIDFLGLAAAKDAIVGYAADGGRAFADIDRLVEDLAHVRVQQPDASVRMQLGNHVEPVQLQVVCHDFWENAHSRGAGLAGGGINSIGDVDQALGRYYANSIAQVAADADRNRAIRTWFGQRLITATGIRAQVLQDFRKSGGLENGLIMSLLDCHLVRAEQRAEATWYELSHDRLVDPILKSNQEWFRKNLHPIQRRAALWVQEGRPDSLLTRGVELSRALRWANKADLPEDSPESEFLLRSLWLRESLLRETRQARIGLAAIFLLAILAIMLAIWALDSRKGAQQEADNAKLNLAIAFQEKSQAALAVDPRRAFLFRSEALKLDVGPNNSKLDWDSMRPIVDWTKLQFSFSNRWFSPAEIRNRSEDNDGFVPLGDFRRTGSIADYRTAQDARRPEWYTDPVLAVAYSPNGRRLISVSIAARVRQWDVSSGMQVDESVTELAGSVLCAAFSLDGSRLAQGTQDGTVLVSDAQTGEAVVDPFRGHGTAVWSVALSPDGSRLASGSKDGEVWIWNMRAGVREAEQSFKRRAEVRSLAFSPDASRLALGLEGGAVEVVDLRTGEPIDSFSLGRGARVRSLAFSPDGSRLASGSEDGTVRVWSARTVEPEVDPLLGHRGSVRSVAFSPDGASLATGSEDGTVRTWDTPAKGQLSESSDGSQTEVRRLALSRDGVRLATVSEDGTVSVWNTQTRELIFRHSNEYGEITLSLAFSPNKGLLATGSEDGAVRVWDLGNQGLAYGPVYGHCAGIQRVVFSPDGIRLASGSEDGTVRVWDLKESSFRAEHALQNWNKTFDSNARHQSLVSDALWALRRRQSADSAKGGLLIENTGWILSHAFSPDGSGLTLGHSRRRQSDGTTGDSLSLHDSRVTSLAFSPDGSLLASGSSDGEIIFWNASSGESVGDPLQMHGDRVSSLAFSPDSRLLASGSRDGEVHLWNVFSWDSVRDTLHGTKTSVSDLVFSPDGSRLISGSIEGRVHTWDTSTGESLAAAELARAEDLTCLALSPDGRRLAFATGDGAISLADLRPYTMFINRGRPTQLFREFVDGARFFWQLKLENLEFVHFEEPSFIPYDGYYFSHPPDFRTLLNPPRSDQSKFDQVLEWAEKRIGKKRERSMGQRLR